MKNPGTLARAALVAALVTACGSSAAPGTDPGTPADDGPADAADAVRDEGLPADPGRDPGAELPGDVPGDPGGLDAGPDVVTASAWGWISAIETNDSCDQWFQKTLWFGGVRAYFATAPNYNRALPHTLGFARIVDSEGDCVLYDSGLMNDDCLGMCACLDKGVECYSADESQRWCPEDQYCIADPDLQPGEFNHGLCKDLPAHFNVGPVTIGGLKTPVTMTPDELDRYKATPANPDDLFDAGDAITATTTGGPLPPLTFHATGVAPLEVPNPVVAIRPGVSPTLSWTPADPQSRVQVVLNAGSHDPNPLGGAIVCDAPDGQGQVQIAARLLDRLWYLMCNGQWNLKCSRMTRYSRDLKSGQGLEVELFVGSARNVQMDWKDYQP